MSRVCEEFRCVPETALAQLGWSGGRWHDDRGGFERLILRIIDLRTYAHAWQRWKNRGKKENLNAVPLIDVVIDNDLRVKCEQAGLPPPPPV